MPYMFDFRYTLLHVLEFDSTRKRMSVIVKSPNGMYANIVRFYTVFSKIGIGPYM